MNIGRPTDYLFDMDRIDRNRLIHPYAQIPVSLAGTPSVVPGKIGGALQLNGNAQYASLGSQVDACMGNLDLCPHGALWASWLRPQSLTNNMQLMSTGINGMSMHYNNGLLMITLRTTSRVWTMEIPGLSVDTWYFLEIDWHPSKGLAVYMNNQLRGHTNSFIRRDKSELINTIRGQDDFYIGRGGTMQGKGYGHVTIDDMEYWYGNRDYLLAFDYIQRGIPYLLRISMDQLRNGKIVHPSLDLPVYGNARVVPAHVNNGLHLDGNNQYLEVDAYNGSCLGYLEQCNHGITSSFWANFAEFNNKDYYFSNGEGIQIYHLNDQLYFVFENEGKQWSVEIPDIPLQTWQFIEYTWLARKGLRVYIDNVLRGMDDTYDVIPEGYPSSDQSRVLIGRSNPADDVSPPGFGDFTIDAFETWYSDRDYLLAWDLIYRGTKFILTYLSASIFTDLEAIRHDVYFLENETDDFTVFRLTNLEAKPLKQFK